MNSIRRIMANIRGIVPLLCEDFSDEKVFQDVIRWKKIYHLDDLSNKQAVVTLLYEFKEFRNLYIYRKSSKRVYRTIIKLLYRPMDTLYIYAKDIGGGLFIQHGFATMISAEYIGDNCWINQQVTIGYKGEGPAPYIEDNVMITCGAKVLGNIRVGRNAIIGANAVVIHDVEEGSVVGGIPAIRIK